MSLNRFVSRAAPMGLALGIGMLCLGAIISLSTGHGRAALTIVGIVFGLLALALIMAAATWLILWPRTSRPAFGDFIRALLRGEPLTPPGVRPRQ